MTKLISRLPLLSAAGCVGCLVLGVCWGGGGGVGAAAAVVVSLAVDPPEASIESSAESAGTQAFTAIATFDDGTVEPIDLVSWELSNQAAGTIDADGLFTATTTNGAITTVTATHNGIEAEATLTVVYDETIVDSGTATSADFDGTPSGTIDWLYPADGVAVPRNVPSLTFMWDPVSGADGYRLSFTTPTTAITVLTTDTHWSAEEERWEAISATNAGGQVQVEVRAIAGGVLYGSDPLTLTVNRMDAQGSIYYWSTTDQGVVKVPIAATEGEIFYTPHTNAPYCVACHVVREDRMGVTYSNPNTSSFFTGITDISGDTVEELVDITKQGYFNTMNPAGTRMITSSAIGVLNLWNAETGEFIGPIDSGGRKLTMPDWSQDGTMLAAIAPGNMQDDKGFTDGVLVVATIDDDGNLGPITEVFDPLAAFGRDEYDQPNVYYPAISPDGEWIAFNYGDGEGYNNETSQLYVVSIDGGDAIALDNANQGPDLTNSWPHWGPLPDDDIYWLTYSSHRAYGDEITDERPQIWVAAFDPALAEQGVDPSYPAFWLPNQDPETSNHSTFWGP